MEDIAAGKVAHPALSTSTYTTEEDQDVTTCLTGLGGPKEQKQEGEEKFKPQLYGALGLGPVASYHAGARRFLLHIPSRLHSHCTAPRPSLSTVTPS